MAPTTLLSQVTGQIDAIVVTGALRDGHWLQHEDTGGYMVLFVAFDLAREAEALWPKASMWDPTGVRE